jgi:hypothetical protein
MIFSKCGYSFMSASVQAMFFFAGSAAFIVLKCLCHNNSGKELIRSSTSKIDDTSAELLQFSTKSDALQLGGSSGE